MNENLIWQYRRKPKATKTIALLSRETTQLLKSTLAVGNALNIHEATGHALDLVGKHVGISRSLKSFIPRAYFGFHGIESALGFSTGIFYREGDSLTNSTRLSDDDYRFFIQAQITKNYQYPTIENITTSIRHLLGDNAVAIDNYNMSMNIVIPSHHLTPFRLYAISKMDILCRPIGVRYQYIIITQNKTFGWQNDASAFGFGVGMFARAINVD